MQIAKHQIKTCEVCQKEYTPRSHDQKTCSKACRRIRKNKYKREHYYKNKEDYIRRGKAHHQNHLTFKEILLLQVYERDRFCQNDLCGIEPVDIYDLRMRFQIDRIIPDSEYSLKGCRLLCRRCNGLRGRGSDDDMKQAYLDYMKKTDKLFKPVFEAINSMDDNLISIELAEAEEALQLELEGEAS